MIDGDISSASVITYKTITETQNDGTTITKRVKIALDSPSNVSTAIGTPADDNLFDFEPANTPPPQEESPNQSRVSFTLKHEIFSMLDS